ncbi:MAG: DUF4386 domain-containing protein [Gemmatimonadota bacterium]
MTNAPEVGAMSASAAPLKEISPKGMARIIGGLLLVSIVAGGVAQGFIGGSLIVPGDASATAANITTHQSLYRLAFAVYLIEMSCQIAMTVLFYQLLKPVSRSLALVAATLGVVGCTVKTMSRLFFFAPLLLLGGAHYLAEFGPKQLEATAFLSLRLNSTVETMAMVFFGLFAISKSLLVLRSTFLPRFLGVLGVIGGLGWSLYLYEPLAHRAEAWIVGTGVLGALTEVLWLLIKGVDEERWYVQASAARASIWL